MKHRTVCIHSSHFLCREVLAQSGRWELKILFLVLAKYEAMLQKLAVIREARESLNDMRAQHQEKAKQQELEQEMLRRMQMEQKLELMRQQKQEYLEYQRALQLQRQQELDMFQMDKLRQKQAYGMTPGFQGIRFI